MRILGIDPGLNTTGYGCLDLGAGVEPTLVEGGVLRLDGRSSIGDRLVQLHDDLAEVMDELRPGLVVVEQLFSHAKHVRTAITMGHARGVVLLVARHRGVEIDELAATAVKRAVAGNGHATKLQMQQAIMVQCGLAQPPEPNDVADAIAIALCAARRLGVVGH